MARKKRKVSGPSAAPPVAADFRLLKPSRSFSARNRISRASAELSPRASAWVPSRMPRSNSRCLPLVESIIRERTSAATLSHTRGASSTKVGPISRRSAIIVSGSSTKLTMTRAISAWATA